MIRAAVIFGFFIVAKKVFSFIYPAKIFSSEMSFVSTKKIGEKNIVVQ